MRHMGDLQSLGRLDSPGGRAPIGSYSARRSHWRFAIGSLEVGFDRASERIHAETAQPRRAQGGFGQRVMILLGMAFLTLLTIIVAGWLGSSDGPVIGGETVSAAIIDRSAVHRAPADAGAGPAGMQDRVVIPTERPAAFLSAVIEERAPAPAVPPAARAVTPIAQGEAIAPRPAEEQSTAAVVPDEAVLQSGNFLLIPNVERAVGLAMRSGDAQNWAAGTYHGVVVVGDANPREGKSCREGTILLRDGTTQGRTQSFERCL